MYPYIYTGLYTNYYNWFPFPISGSDTNTTYIKRIIEYGFFHVHSAYPNSCEGGC